jgi:hypothetical protein
VSSEVEMIILVEGFTPSNIINIVVLYEFNHKLSHPISYSL